MTVRLAPLAKYGFGSPASGSKLWTYAAGTTTPQASYTDSTGGTPNANPIVFDSRGEANVWLTEGLGYKLTHLSAADALLWTVDNILLPVPPAAASMLPTGAAFALLTGVFTAAAYAGQGVIPLAGFFSTGQLVLLVRLTVTQQFGASNGLATLALGTIVSSDFYGGGLTLTTGAKGQRGTPWLYTTATDLRLSAEGGAFDATGAASVTALVVTLA